MSLNRIMKFLPMKIEDLGMIYELEIESYEFPWTRNLKRFILYNYDSYSVFFGDILVGYVIKNIIPRDHMLNLQ